MVAPPLPRSRPAALPVAALVLVGFLGSMTTLRADLFPDLLPDLLPSLQRQLLALGICSVLAGAAALVRKSRWPSGPLLRTAILLGLGLFVIPTLFSQLTIGSVSAVTRAALLPLASFFAVVFEPFLADNRGGQSRGALLASMAAAAGTLLVLPVALPDSLQASLAWLALGFASACVGAVSCVGFRATTGLVNRSETRTSTPFMMAPFAAVSSGVGFLGLAAVATVTQSNPVRWAAVPFTLLWTGAIDLPALCLVFWLMPRLSAPRFTTRFTLTLLVPVIVGAPLLGTHLSLRDWSGVAMMMGGTAYLLFAPDELPDAPGLSLR